MRKRKWHIYPRIFVMLIILMVFVFASIFIAFNLFIHNYIRTNVESQLNDLTSNYDMYNDKRYDWSDPGEDRNSELPDLSEQPKSKIGANGEIFMVNADYEILEYDWKSDIDELTLIADNLKSNNISLVNASYQFVGTEQGKYYVSTTPDKLPNDTYMVFYVNVTALDSLVDTINLALVIIVAVAMLVCFMVASIIANSVTKPVAKLSRFAVEIGKGNFDRQEFAFTDVELNALAVSMNQAAEKLDLYDKDQRTFFQNVSHELRTPLMSIRCYAEGIQYGLMDGKKAGATIISETDRLTELVEDLLYISRVDNLTQQIEKHEYDLRDTLSVCAESLKSVSDKNGIRMEYQFDVEPVLFVYNEKHMHRAFTNLIANAIRYAKTTITLGCHKDRERVIVWVKDDGIGISAEDLPHIFERFYKGHGGKHGLGLSIVKSVVELHGGEISVKNDDGSWFGIGFSARSFN